MPSRFETWLLTVGSASAKDDAMSAFRGRRRARAPRGRARSAAPWRRRSAAGASFVRKPLAPARNALDDVLVEAERREHADAAAREAAGRLDAVDLQHPDVHERDVGRVRLGRADRLDAGVGAAVAGGAVDVEVLAAGEVAVEARLPR